MTPAERRRVARVLREAARIVAEGDGYVGVWEALDNTRPRSTPLLTMIWDAIESLFPWPETHLPFDEPHRHIRVIALLLTAEAVLTGDCDD
jgi:hypothetical protein